MISMEDKEISMEDKEISMEDKEISMEDMFADFKQADPTAYHRRQSR